MDLDLYNQRFSTAQVAKMLGVTSQSVNKRAGIHGWKRAPSRTQGGGYLWLYKDMDKDAKKRISLAAIKAHQAANPVVTPEQQRLIDAKWQEFDKKCGSIKERAFKRQSFLLEVIELRDAGSTLSAAFTAVSQMHGVSVGTLRNWYYGTNGKDGVGKMGLDPKDWPPFLADNHKGRVARAHCDETAWEFLKKDYLRKEKPSFLSVFRRLSEAAMLHAWIIPSARTLYRRLFEELEWTVIEYLRTGKLFNDYPDQIRRRDTFRAGQAVSGDALSFDKIHVVDETTGEVFNPRTWFFEDVYSGKIVSWATDKTENSDMFRRSVYELTGEFLPEYMYIDNTRAAANKCLTGQVSGRHRFTDKATDPVGLLKHLKINVHFTNPDHEIASPGSKPIERAFGIGGLHQSMREHPSLMGRATFKNPIPYSEFLALLPQIVAEHNARKGRTGGVCNGRSFDEVYAASVGQGSLRKPSPELRSLLLCSQEVCKVSKHGTVTLKAGQGEGKHRYYGEGLSRYAGEDVAVLFNPDNLTEPVAVYDLEARRLGTADWLPATAFNDTKAAREHAKHKARRKRFTKQAAREAVLMSELEFKQLNAPVTAGETPEPAHLTTVLSEQEVENRLSGKHKVSAERQNELRANLHKNINALSEEDAYPFAAQA